MQSVVDFGEAINITKDEPKTVLLGNGFSIARAGGVFNYANLLEKADLATESPIKKVFDVLQTSDFEEVMNALEHAAKIEQAYGDDERSSNFLQDAAKVREALIQAVRAVHPGVRFEIPDKQIDSCANFLDNFVNIFTLNYDLQMYWVILQRLQRRHTDGFGLGNETNGFRTFSESAYCSTYYLHGALHLFEDEKGGTRKRILTSSMIVDDIAETIRNSRQLPLFVAEGSTLKKLKKINSVPYLRYCYENLKKISGSLIVFGHSASENDIHIYDAIFSSPELKKVFFCVHSPEHDWSQLRERLARFGERRKDVEACYVNAATAGVWS
jgi:hypothetical protein